MTMEPDGPAVLSRAGAAGSWPASEPRANPCRVGDDQPHPARVYDFWLGGKDNFAADRALAGRIATLYPTIRVAARENRAFLQRAVIYLTAVAGIRQFLDLGTGIPAANNTHEVAQSLAPQARVVYVDNDPIVLTHARALLTSSPEGTTDYIDADIRDSDTIISKAAAMLDFTRPVAVMCLMTLQFVPDTAEAYEAVSRFVTALPPGSHLAISAPTADFVPADIAAELMQSYAVAGHPFQFRSRSEFGAFFDGLHLIEPGITPIAEWRAEQEPQPRPSATDVSAYAAIGRVNP